MRQFTFNIGLWMTITAAAFYAHEGGSLDAGLASVTGIILLICSPLFALHAPEVKER